VKVEKMVEKCIQRNPKKEYEIINGKRYLAYEYVTVYQNAHTDRIDYEASKQLAQSEIDRLKPLVFDVQSETIGGVTCIYVR
jgi:hypothetical protein